ncbi:MAG: GNAT family N-acetyltransferase, partial [Fimbriimonadaceae bacterium]
MTEIRPIRGDEAETFLRLLCDVFELDFNRAHGVFFNEPMFDLQSKWALFDRGRMVSILTTVPLSFGWGDAIGIAGVATAPPERGKGRAGALVRFVVQNAFDLGCRSAYLFARQTAVYERVGFEVIDRVVRAPLIG